MSKEKINIYRDGVAMDIDKDKGIEVSHTRDGHVVETYHVNGVPAYFVTLKNSTFCAHGSSIAEAVTDAEWKDPSKRPSREALVKEIQDAGKTRLISLLEFRLLTGACQEGCRIAIARAKVSGGPMTAFDIRDKVSREWGNKLIQLLGWE